jgi:hypothetical protein
MHRTLVMTKDTSLPELSRPTIGMSPMHFALAWVPSAAVNVSEQGRLFTSQFSFQVMLPVHPESITPSICSELMPGRLSEEALEFFGAISARWLHA